VIEEPDVNAFALPGGFIYVTRPLLHFCDQDPHEVAFVVGHEMGHVVLSHTRNRLLADTLISTAISKLTPAGLVAFAMGKLATKFLQQAYSRQDELDADEFGVLLARRTGYDPHAAVRFMERVAARGRTKSGPAKYFAGHPTPRARIDAIRSLLE
jgi:predicted Zn-dependent protease